MTSQWNFLAGTYWYVPTAFLPALQMNSEDTEPTRMVDQTVWQIIGCSGGYLWGNCAALMYAEGTTPDSAPLPYRMAGSITPDGNVQISFMPMNKLGAAMSVSGWGNLKKESDLWLFEMQMASGFTDLVAHWAFMAATEEGEPSWEQLPGTDYAVPAFLEAAGF